MNKKINLQSLLLCALIIFAAASAAAHEKWFSEPQSDGLRWDLFFARCRSNFFAVLKTVAPN